MINVKPRAVNVPTGYARPYKLPDLRTIKAATPQPIKLNIQPKAINAIPKATPVLVNQVSNIADDVVESLPKVASQFTAKIPKTASQFTAKAAPIISPIAKTLPLASKALPIVGTLVDVLFSDDTTISSEDEAAAIKRAQDKLLQAGSESTQELQPETYPFTGGQMDGIKYLVAYGWTVGDRGFGNQDFVWGPIQGIRSRKVDDSSFPWQVEILCKGIASYQQAGDLQWYGNIHSQQVEHSNIQIGRITRDNNQPDTGGNPPPTNQSISSSSGTTIASPQTYQREIGDRQPQPLQKQFQIPMLDFAEPLPKLILIPDLLPVDLAQPDALQDPEVSPVIEPLPLPNPAATDTAPKLGDVTTLFSPFANPGTIKIVQPFGGVAPSSLPNSQPLTNTGVDRTPQPAPLPTKTPTRTADPEKTELEKTREDLEKLITSGAAIAGLTPAIQTIGDRVNQTARQTTPEAIATAAETGTCNAFAPNGCNADIKDNAKKAADNSGSNSNKLDKLTDAADLALDADTNLRVRNIEDKTGSNEYPMILPEYLMEDSLDKQVVITNQVQFNAWLLKNLSALIGIFPIKIERQNENGTKEILKLENLAETQAELIGILAKIAFDADTAVNVGIRSTAEGIGARTAALQAGSYLKAIIDYLGFQTQPEPFPIKISCTIGATGIDGNLQESELDDFLKPSTQTVLGLDCKEQDDLHTIIKRILFDAEIARAALYKPLKPDKINNNLSITGDGIKAHRKKEEEKVNKKWEEFKTKIEGQTNLPFKIDIDEKGTNTTK